MRFSQWILTAGGGGARSAMEGMIALTFAVALAVAVTLALSIGPAAVAAPPPALSTAASLSVAANGRALVREVQTLLTTLGYDPGPVDGLAGRRVRRAVAAFQQDANLPVTGKVDTALLQTLRAAATPPKQPEPRALAPAPRSETAPAPPPEQAMLVGQTWRFVDDDGAEMVLTFAADGRVRGPAFADAMRWRQHGDAFVLTFETTLGGRIERQGRLSGPDILQGVGAVGGAAGDAAPRRWRWRATRVR